MCGIAGAFCPHRSLAWRGLVEEVVDGQRRRGPDHQAVETVFTRGATAVLGHDRLSIIDLSEAAHQPMWDGSGRHCVVFNGEIYNYTELRRELETLGHEFRTRSDTEVLLEAHKAWGDAAVERFNGMFAYALLDAQDETVRLVRDRLGVKPLYYAFSAGALLFASTGTVLAQGLGLEPDLAYVARGLRYRVYEDDAEASPYEGLSALRPGHVLTCRVGGAGEVTGALRAYYDLRARVDQVRHELAGRPVDDLVRAVAAGLEDAVAVRLRADVPVGISLSGGLDSSSVASLLGSGHSDVTGFAFGDPAAAGSEGPLVAQLARHAGIRVEYVWPGLAEVVHAFWETLAAQDAPFPGGSVVAQYLVFRAARSRDVKVLLGGQGGDEVFLGYRKHLLFRLRRLTHERRYPQALAFALGLLPTLAAELPRLAAYCAAGRTRYGGSRRPSALRLPEPAPVALGSDPRRPAGERQVQDVTRLSLPTLLRYEDRNSMGNSVESRLPFVDYRLVELGLALPEEVRLRSGFGKWVLREAMRRRIPEAIRAARYKRGFDVNQAEWLRGGLGAAVREGIRARGSRAARWLAPGINVDDAFSDRRLTASPTALAEATTLLWLGDRTR